jgi:disulfide bond formation protein DsbB
MSKLMQIRPVFLALFLLPVIAMAFAVLFLQQALGLAPCPLCITQRVFVVGVGLFALLAFLHNPGAVGRRIYGALCSLSALAGATVAGRHVWLQGLPPDQVPACGPSLGYMLETLPLSKTFSLVMMGDGNCADTQWTFLGMSIPEQTLLLFIVLFGLSLWQTLRRG